MKITCAIGLVALLGLAGCFSLSRVEPQQQHYVLGDGLQIHHESPALDREGISIAVRRLQLAAYLETAFVVVRRGPHRITFSEFHRWGEQLSGGINRAVAGDLVSRAHIRSVDVAPWPAGERYDYIVQIHVQHFEGVAPAEGEVAEGVVHLLATWEIIEQQSGAVVERGTTDFRRGGWIVDDFPGLVSTLNSGLNVLADDIAARLDQLATERPAPLTTR